MKIQCHNQLMLAHSELNKVKWFPYNRNSQDLNVMRGMVNMQERDTEFKFFSTYQVLHFQGIV